MQEEWGHEVAAEALPAEEGVAIEGEVLEAVPVYAEEGMKEMISQEEEEAPGTVVFEYREDDGGRWHPYDEATCQRLEHASRQGDARVSLPGRRRYTAIGLGEENEDGMILGDSRFTASSEFSSNCIVATGRLNKPGARWAPTSNDMHAGTSWMQVKLPGARLIGRIATQGNGSYQEWTTAYRVKHSMDGETWVDYAQKLDGNADQHTVVTHDFEPPFECKFVRVLPTSWHRHACLRIELYQTSAEPEETEVRFGVPAWESPTGIAETNPADGSTRVVRRVIREPERKQEPHAGVDLTPNSASFQSAVRFKRIIHTAEFWVKVPRGTSGRVGILMGQGYPYADKRSLHHAINFEIHERGRPRIWWNSGEVDWKCGDIDLRTGKWTHLAFVIHEAMDAATVFVDGEEISTTRTRFARVVATRPPRFGGDERAGNGIGNVPPQFQLRAVRVWSVARTQQQLQRYATAALCLGDGLMLHYYLDAAKHAGGCIVDDSSSGNNARIVGGRRLTWLNGDSPVIAVKPPPPPPCCTMM